MRFTIVRTYLHIYNFHYSFVYIFYNLMSRLRSYFHKLVDSSLVIALQENIDLVRTSLGDGLLVPGQTHLSQCLEMSRQYQ